MATLNDELQGVSRGADFIRADLHIHSFGPGGSYEVSDSQLTPEAIVDTAVRENLGIISITDHNVIGNVQAAVTYSSGKSVVVIPGVELSTPQGHLLIYLPTVRDLQRFFGHLTISDDRKTCA